MGRLPLFSLLNINANSGEHKSNEVHGSENNQATGNSKIAQSNYDKSENGDFVRYLQQQLEKSQNEIIKLTEQKNYFQYRLNLLQTLVNERKKRKAKKKKIKLCKRSKK